MRNLVEPRWLSVLSAGHRASVTSRTIRDWEAAGLLTLYRVIKPGAARGTVRIDILELDALIERSVAPASVLKMNAHHLSASES